MTPSERGRLIWKLGDLIDQHIEEFAFLESLDNGKPLTVARAADVPLAAELFRYMAGWATKIEGNTIPLSVPYTPKAKYLSYTLREPVGVVGQIIPWNFPLLMAAWKLGPALATGCTVVLKPAEQTPLSALRLGELIMEAGFPEGVVNIVPGYGETAGAALAAHMDVDKVAFTGSTEVGKLIVHAATGNLKKVSLELGGKSPNVVFKDADLDVGDCRRGQRDLLQSRPVLLRGIAACMWRSRYSTRSWKASRRTPRKSMWAQDWIPIRRWGRWSRKSSSIAFADISNPGSRKAQRPWRAARSMATRVTSSSPRCWSTLREDMKVVQEEIFGPVVVAMPFTDPEELVPRANDNVYGLAAGIWTRDISKAHRMAELICRRARCGSTATTSLTQLCPLADTSNPAGDARWAMRC